MNKDNFETVYIKYFNVLCLFSMKIVKDSRAAEDIVQDVYLQCWQRWGQLDFSESIKPYLYKLTYNKSLDYLRLSDNKNLQISQNITLVDQIYYSTFTDDDDGANDKLNQELLNSINLLPDRCKEVFLLSRQSNFKNREIADKLNISIKTVEKHISKALSDIRLRLTDLGYLVISFLTIIQFL